MRLALIDDNDKIRTLADLDGDGLDDETGGPVEAPAEEAAPEAEADEAEAEADEEEAPVEETGDLTAWVLAVEGEPTGDNRYIAEGALTWRDLPLPLMATDVTGEGHDGAMLVANIVSIAREGAQIVGQSRMIDSDDETVLRLQKLIADGDLRGVSVDLDAVEGNIVFEEPETIEEVGPDGEPLPGAMPLTMPRTNITAGRIMGATAVPFPAFAQAGQAALLAGAGTIDTEQPQAAAINAPTEPPASWFLDPQLSAPTPLTVTDEGRIFGHVALWQSCHRGFSECTPPPRAPNGSYSHFHTGKLRTSDGNWIEVGQITVDSGHADLSASAKLASEHYDHTGWVGADVRCGEDQHGIYLAGSARPDLDALGLRKLMACDVSGDWRSIDGRLQMIGLASVPVPGFVKTTYSAGGTVAMVASVPVCEGLDSSELKERRIAARIAASIGRTPEQRQAERDRVAFGIGRHPSQQRARLADRIRKA